MGKHHTIKLKGIELCNAVYSGRKKYEIRINDRDYCVYDTVSFIPVDDCQNIIQHPVSDMKYLITFMSKECEGILCDGYCVFAIEPIFP